VISTRENRIYITGVGWLDGWWHLLLRDFEPYRIVFMNVCVIAVAMVMLLRNFEPYGVVFVSRGSSVSIVSVYGLDDRTIDVRSLAEAKGFFL
jgi:hypothetical protein